MKIKLKQQSKRFEFTFELEDSDKEIGIGQGGKQVRLAKKDYYFNFPFEVERPHPDLVALAIVCILHPWIGKKITFPMAISSKFAEALNMVYGYEIENTDVNLKPRQIGNVPALSFSTGIDSTAAKIVMPSNTRSITFIRSQENVIQPNTFSVLESLKHFDNVDSVDSDIEYLINPNPQFATWVALSAQCILLADKYNFNSINYGAIMGSTYLANGTKFTDYKYAKLKGWFTLFNEVGVPISKPVTGLSEIGTFTIVNNSKYVNVVNSCAYGEFQKPCMKCTKCFRKYLTQLAVTKEKINKEIMNIFLQQPGVINLMGGDSPTYFQHIYMYALSYIDTSKFKILDTFKNKLFLVDNDTKWCNKHYEESLDQVPVESLKDYVKMELQKTFESMNDEDLKNLKNWNLIDAYKNIGEDKKIKLREYNKVIADTLPVPQTITKPSLRSKIKNKLKYIFNISH